MDISKTHFNAGYNAPENAGPYLSQFSGQDLDIAEAAYVEGMRARLSDWAHEMRIALCKSPSSVNLRRAA